MLNETWALRIFTAVFDFKVANTNQSLVAKLFVAAFHGTAVGSEV